MRKDETETKKLSPAPEKLSQAHRQIFLAGFVSGLAYRGCPKFSPTDPMALKEAMDAADEMFDLMEADGEAASDGKSQIQSIARILGLNDDEPEK